MANNTIIAKVAAAKAVIAGKDLVLVVVIALKEVD